MKRLFAIALFWAFCLPTYGNFGGYVRHSTPGGGAILNASGAQMIKLVREKINIHLDQRVSFEATFWLENTSDQSETVTLAFPQLSYWDVPYKDGGYQPGDYVRLNETFSINGVNAVFTETLFSQKVKGYDLVELQSKAEFADDLVSYAQVHEAMPTMPVIIWKVREISFEPGEQKELKIAFKRPWFYEDASWSTGVRSDGLRSFDYVFETAKTWKNGSIGQFDMEITFPPNAVAQLDFNREDLQKEEEYLYALRKTGWVPGGTENLKIEWVSKYLFTAPEDPRCWNIRYYSDYSWRFASDGSTQTSWCFKPADLACSGLAVREISPEALEASQDGLVSKNSASDDWVTTLNVVNGFAKTAQLASQNAMPKVIWLEYKGVDGSLIKQKVELKESSNHVQRFRLDEKTRLSEPFKIRFEGFYTGTRYDDICLAEIWFD